jgi:hypothetical protein
MNDKLTATLGQEKSRRGLLALVGAGGAAALAALLSRSNGAQAGHGSLNASSSTADPAIHGDNTDGGPGVEGTSDSGFGVLGRSQSGDGVHGSSPSGTAGHFTSQSGDGVSGESQSGFGVFGRSQSGPGVAGQSQSGNAVEGFSEIGAGAFVSSLSGPGVDATSESGPGVLGWSPGGAGVTGIGSILRGEGTVPEVGPGVLGVAPGNAAAVQCVSGGVIGGDGPPVPDPDGGLALDVVGKARFSTAGAGTIPTGQNSRFVPNPAVTANSHITVTLASNPGPRQLWWVEGNPGVGFRVRLTQAPGPRPATNFTYLIVEPA